jgi:signal transduction histidine kinase
VRVEYAADRVAVEVANDGASVAHGSGFGLRGLAERVAHVGGTVRSGPVGRGRWLLAAVLPYEVSEGPA